MTDPDGSRVRGRLALVGQMRAGIGTTLDAMRTARELVAALVPRLAETAWVDLREDVLEGGEPLPGLPGKDALLRRAAHRSRAVRGAVPAMAEGGVHVFLPGVLPAQVVAGEAPVLDAADPERGARLVVPLRARDITVGVVVLERPPHRPAFDEGDVMTAMACGNRAAEAIDNARHYTRERDIALTLQRSLLPQRLASFAVMDAASRYIPASGQPGLGGDWFDVIALSGARVGLVVGDVIGHDLQATVTMGRLRTVVRTLADLDLQPNELFAHLDEQVRRLVEEKQEDTHAPAAAGSPVLGAACLYAVYDPVARRCVFTRAGHQPPAVVAPDGRVGFVDLPANPLLGLGGEPFESTEVDVPDGSLLALYTDGLVDARDHPDAEATAGVLVRELGHPERTPEEMCAAVVRALVPECPSDDVALLVARPRPLSADQYAEWDVSFDPSAVVVARARVGRQLTRWGLEELHFTVELIAGELLTNAIRYGEPPVRLRLIKADALICEVCDGSSTAPHLRRARTDEEGGRGLFLVARLARSWGTRYTRDGKIVWAEHSLSPTGTGLSGLAYGEPEFGVT